MFGLGHKGTNLNYVGLRVLESEGSEERNHNREPYKDSHKLCSLICRPTRKGKAQTFKLKPLKSTQPTSFRDLGFELWLRVGVPARGWGSNRVRDASWQLVEHGKDHGNRATLFI